jgi:hypothetical protein
VLKELQMKTLPVAKIAKNLVEFTAPIILEQKANTRRCFYAELACDVDGVWNLRGDIIHERKGKDGWLPLDGPKLSQLKAGEISKLELRTEHLKKFIVGLQVLKDAAAEKGIEFGDVDLVVGRRDEMMRVDADQKAAIEQLISNDHSAEFWATLSSLRPDLTAQLADAELLRRRRISVAQFEDELQMQRWSETDWEKFFQTNQWIFGLGLRFQFLSVLQNQANYGGADLTRRGEQKGEFLMNTEADEHFTVLVEIKRPDTRFFSGGPSYRNGTPGFDPGFTNAISQVQVNTHTWEIEGSRRERDAAQLAEANVRTISPRSILVCGHTHELDNIDKRKAFELFRCKLTSPDIVTFDELLARARFITRDTATL